jgi:hypothetical protein
MLRLICVAAMASICAFQISGATLTLSQPGILALDHKASWQSASILRAVPSGNGVEYTIWFSGVPAQVYLESSASGGNGALVGLPLSSADTFALQFTLLSSTAGPKGYVAAGAIVNRERSHSAYAPILLGGPHGNTAISSTSTDASTTKILGFKVSADQGDDGWPAAGGIVRLLVEPAPNATVLEPASIKAGAYRGYRDRILGETLTLSQHDVLALDHKTAKSTSILSAAPSGNGVEYTIWFDDRSAGLQLDSSVNGGSGALTGLPLSSADTFALRFTLVSSTAGPDAYVSAGAMVNQQRSQYAFSPVELGARGSTGVSSTATDASTTKILGFTVYIAPHNAKSWPAAGGVVRVLVEPAPNAWPLEAPVRAGR